MIAALSALSIPRKAGLLFTSEAEPSATWELIRSGGWSLDAVATPRRSGIGIARDIYRSPGLVIDLGAYAVGRNDDLLRGRVRPEVGVGVSVGF